MRALVTGGSGFLGAALRSRLGTDGDAITTIPHQLLGNPAALARTVSHACPQVVFHLAFDHPHGEDDVDRALAANMAMQQALFAATDQEALFVIAGTAAQYGHVATQPIGEDEPLCPVSPYGLVKARLEEAARASGCRVVWTRIFNVVGPGQPPGFPLADWVRQVAAIERGSGLGTITTGPLEVERDVLDVRDVAGALRAAASTPAGTVTNVCSGAGVTLGQLLAMVLDLTTATVAVERDLSIGPPPVARAVGDPSRLRALTGWAPQIGHAEGVRDNLEEVRRS